MTADNDARRTCATLLVDLEVHQRVTMRIPRHADVSMTLEIYANACADGDARSASQAGGAPSMRRSILVFVAVLVLTAASNDDEGVTFGDDVKSPRVHVRAGLRVVMLSRSSSCCRGLAGMAAPPLCALSRCVPVREAGRGRSLR